MLYNNNRKKVKTALDCLTCEYFDQANKKCVGGIGKNCFEYDPKTQTIIDPKTKLPINLIKGE